MEPLSKPTEKSEEKPSPKKKEPILPLKEEKKEQKDQIIEDVRIKASPLADSKLTVKLLYLLKQANSYKQLKKGMNESLKTLSRSRLSSPKFYL